MDAVRAMTVAKEQEVEAKQGFENHYSVRNLF